MIKQSHCLITNVKKGILLMLISSIFVAFTGLIVKKLETYPLFEVVFFRNVFSMIALSIIIIKRKIPIFGQNKNLLYLRSFLAFINLSAYYYTFTKMSLTDAITIRQMGPIITAVLSMFLLKEKFYIKYLFIFICAFIGSGLVIKPGMRVDLFPVVIGMLSTFLYALSHVYVRKLRLTDHPLVIVNYFITISFIFSFIILVYQNSFVIPTIKDLFMFILLSFASAIVQLTLTKSYQLCPASIVALYIHSQILFGVLIDIFYFHITPDVFSVFGTIVIFFSGYLNYIL